VCVLQVLADDRVASYFQSTDMAKQKAHQVRPALRGLVWPTTACTRSAGGPAALRLLTHQQPPMSCSYSQPEVLHSAQQPAAFGARMRSLAFPR
jgi:hypothetical protein